MFAPLEVSPTYKPRASDFRQIISQCLPLAQKSGTRRVMGEDGDTIEVGGTPDAFYWYIEQGFVGLALDGSTVTFYESGDVIGLPLPPPYSPRFRAYGPIKLASISSVQVAYLCESSTEFKTLWNHATDINRTLIQETIEVSRIHGCSGKVAYLYISESSPIIIEDTEPADVYVMLSGSAKVLVKGAIVGSIHCGEIFGSMAASLNSRRTASVIASEPCLIAALKKEHFFELVRTHPETVLKLIENMARIIVQQNEKIAAFSM